MPTYTALTTLPGRAAAERLGAAMERLNPAPTGIGVFEVEDGSGLWEIGGYFADAPDETALAVLAAAFDAKPFVVSEVPDVDWVAKVRRELSPVAAGRFFVYGGHDADKLPHGAIGLRIEAAMAFGTGHHGTTLGCLRALDRLADVGSPPARVADIGCGTAVLAMAAKKLWPGADLLAADIDPVAVEVAEANIAANALAGAIPCLVAAGFDHPMLRDKAPFDLVFANILKGPLIELAPAMASATGTGSHVILSGLLNEQAGDVRAAYAQSGFNEVESERIVDWTTLVLRKI